MCCTVEVDEAKFGKCKYKRGRLVKGSEFWGAFVGKPDTYF